MSTDGGWAPLQPGGETAYEYGPGPDNARLPVVTPPGAGEQVRFRDLPPAEQLRRKVEDTLRFYAMRHKRLLTAVALVGYKKWPEARIPDVIAAMNDPVTVANLRGWGVLPPEVETYDEALAGVEARPARVQMDALEAIFERIDPDDARPLKTILAEHGVSLRTWNGWLTDPVFAAWVRERATAVFGERAHEVDIALMRKALSGETAAIKLILELQGRIRQGDQAVDARALLASVVEIIQLEVTDPATQLRIVERMEALSQRVQRGQLPSGPTVLDGALV